MTGGSAGTVYGSTKEFTRTAFQTAKIRSRTTFLFRRRVTLPSVGSMPIKRIFVRSSAGPYSVVCGTGALGHAAQEIVKLGSFSSVHIVSSAKVWRAVGKIVLRNIGRKNGAAVHLMNDAEAAKNLRTVELLTRELVRGGA